MDTKATATLHDGTTVAGRLTTDHAASSYGQPVFVDDAGQAYDWFTIADISTPTASTTLPISNCPSGAVHYRRYQHADGE